MPPALSSRPASANCAKENLYVEQQRKDTSTYALERERGTGLCRIHLYVIMGVYGSYQNLLEVEEHNPKSLHCGWSHRI